MPKQTINMQIAEMLESMNVSIAMQDPLKFFTAEEVARYFLCTNNRKIVDYAREFGLIKAKKIGKSYLYNRQAIEEFLKKVDGYNIENRDDFKKISEIKKEPRVAIT